MLLFHSFFSFWQSRKCHSAPPHPAPFPCFSFCFFSSFKFMVFFFIFVLGALLWKHLGQSKSANWLFSWSGSSLYSLTDTRRVGERDKTGKMSTAKNAGLKAPSKLAKHTGTGAPKTNPSAGKTHTIIFPLYSLNLGDKWFVRVVIMGRTGMAWALLLAH